MKNYLNLLLGVVLIISALKPFFNSSGNREFDILGFELNKYVYIILHLVLGLVLLIKYYNNQKKA